MPAFGFNLFLKYVVIYWKVKVSNGPSSPPNFSLS